MFVPLIYTERNYEDVKEELSKQFNKMTVWKPGEVNSSNFVRNRWNFVLDYEGCIVHIYEG